MTQLISFKKMALSLAIPCILFSNSFGTGATVANAGFDTFIAATDSFPSWSFKKDSLGGTRYTITQETTGAYSPPGALKMAITPGADTLTSCGITGSITGLPANKLVTVTAMVKYTDMPIYWNAMFNLQQATLLNVSPWTWTDRKWGSDWGNNQGTTDWTPISFVDTTYDSANVFNLVITLAKSGTLWVDDITVTYTNITPVNQKVKAPGHQESMTNNRISFSCRQAYSLEACAINGKILLRKSGIADVVDMNRLSLSCGVYLVSVKAGEKTFTGRVAVER
jgi:hypothetical protein